MTNDTTTTTRTTTGRTTGGVTNAAPRTTAPPTDHAPDHAPVHSDQDVTALVARLIDRAIRRQCWLLFLDGESLPIQLLIPIEDLPASPDDPGFTGMVDLIVSVMPSVDATALVVAWERPGGAVFGDSDLEWARSMSDAMQDAGVDLRGQVLVHGAGVRWIDLGATS